MIVVIPSVEHTGSRLVANHIFHSFQQINIASETEAPYAKQYEHVYANKMEAFHRACKQHPVIIPMRHPIRCAWSWEQRQKPLDEYFKQWDSLQDLFVYDHAVIRVDLKERNEDLKAVNDKLGINVSTFWPYVGERAWPWVSENKPEVIPLESCKLRNETEVLKYIDANKDFFEVYYGH